MILLLLPVITYILSFKKASKHSFATNSALRLETPISTVLALITSEFSEATVEKLDSVPLGHSSMVTNNGVFLF